MSSTGFQAELERLSPPELQQLIERLGLFSKELTGRAHLVWHRVAGQTRLPNGFTHEDLVSEAILAGINGREAGGRNWNRKRYPTIEKFLRSVIRSMVNHLAESTENRETVGLPDDGNEDTDALHDFPACRKPSPREQAASVEFWALLKTSVVDDPDLEMLLMGLEDGYKRSELADVLGKTVDEIDSLKKRLRRRLEKSPVAPARVSTAAKGASR
ncbi:MAG: sigma-70 family RNA polymerase sigma factor [Candidatus Sumerlaeia bacterium]|nr:sigma-70 family RNA polymerase sigma factor [Candidatus Sumerlaeia bacterium]